VFITLFSRLLVVETLESYVFIQINVASILIELAHICCPCYLLFSFRRPFISHVFCEVESHMGMNIYPHPHIVFLYFKPCGYNL